MQCCSHQPFSAGQRPARRLPPPRGVCPSAPGAWAHQGRSCTWRPSHPPSRAPSTGSCQGEAHTGAWSLFPAVRVPASRLPWLWGATDLTPTEHVRLTTASGLPSSNTHPAPMSSGRDAQHRWSLGKCKLKPQGPIRPAIIKKKK